jgi:hypothetical protein
MPGAILECTPALQLFDKVVHICQNAHGKEKGLSDQADSDFGGSIAEQPCLLSVCRRSKAPVYRNLDPEMIEVFPVEP